VLTLSCLQENKYRDAIRYYQPLVARNADNLLGVTAIALANLCVSYIMTSQVGWMGQGVCVLGSGPLLPAAASCSWLVAGVLRWLRVKLSAGLAAHTPAWLPHARRMRRQRS
jgi:hypothetical protein